MLRITKTDGVSKGYNVEYRQCDRVTASKSQYALMINNHPHPIEWHDDQQVPTVAPQNIPAELLPPPPDIKSNIVNTLNSDCLRALFELADINMADLTELADTCKQFEVIARQVYQMKLKQHPNYAKQMDYWTLETIEKYFIQFGKELKSIDLIWSTDSLEVNDIHHAIVMGFVKLYCTQLKELHCSLRDRQATYKRLFRQLHTLHLGASTVNLFRSIQIRQSRSYPIRSLRLDNCHVELPTIVFPHLEEIRIQRSNIQLASYRKQQPSNSDGDSESSNEPQSAIDFFQLNTQLKRIEFTEIHDRFCPTNAIRGLVNLEELTLIKRKSQATYTDLKCFKRLTKLRTIHLSMSAPETMKALRELEKNDAPLERVTIEHLFMEDGGAAIIDVLCDLKHITDLRIHRCLDCYCTRFRTSINTTHLQQIWRGLPQLKHFHVDSKDIDVNSVRDVIAQAEHLETAMFTILSRNLASEEQKAEVHATFARIARTAEKRKIDTRVEILNEVSVLNLIFEEFVLAGIW